METSYPNNTKSNRIKFIGLYIFSVILMGVMMASFWGPLPSYKKTKTPELSKITGQDADKSLFSDSLLHKQLDNLYQTYNENQLGTSDTVYAKNKIDSAEQVLKNTLDEFEKSDNELQSENAEAAKANVVSSFRSAVNAFERLRTSADNITTKNNNNDNDVIRNLTADLKTREERVRQLEDELKTKTSNNSPNTPPDIQKLQQENKFLSSSLSDVVNQNSKLIKANNSQKQTIEKLNKQLDAFRKFTGQ